MSDRIKLLERVLRAARWAAEHKTEMDWWSELDLALLAYDEAVKPRPQEREGYCDICGGELPEGEKMFRFHGYSGDCPSTALDTEEQKHG